MTSRALRSVLIAGGAALLAQASGCFFTSHGQWRGWQFHRHGHAHYHPHNFGRHHHHPHFHPHPTSPYHHHPVPGQPGAWGSQGPMEYVPETPPAPAPKSPPPPPPSR